MTSVNVVGDERRTMLRLAKQNDFNLITEKYVLIKFLNDKKKKDLKQSNIKIITRFTTQ